MKKLNFVSLLILSIAATQLSACGRLCQKAQDEVVQPVQKVATYLSAAPSGEDIAINGCPVLLQDISNIPSGAEAIRQIAETRFTHTYSRCLYWSTSYRYYCTPELPARPPRCHAEPYSYCAQWEYDVVRDPGYAMTLELSQDLDLMYEKTHHMCGQAAAGNLGQAQFEGRELLVFMNERILMETNRFYGMACRR